MGCDIHIWTEQKIRGEWRPADPPHEDADYRRYAEIYDDRNYELFAMLAGVRNRYDIKPVSEPKGLPDDLSPEVREDMYLEHTPSWLTLAELKAYDWRQTFSREVLLNFPQFKEYVEKGEPSGWCMGAGGGNVRHVSPETMHLILSKPDAVMRPGDAPDFSNVYAPIKWRETYAEAAGRFYSEVMPQLERMAEGDPEGVRIVFYFDS